MPQHISNSLHGFQLGTLPKAFTAQSIARAVAAPVAVQREARHNNDEITLLDFLILLFILLWGQDASLYPGTTSIPRLWQSRNSRLTTIIKALTDLVQASYGPLTDV